jgi:hypothetical protein
MNFSKFEQQGLILLRVRVWDPITVSAHFTSIINCAILITSIA